MGKQKTVQISKQEQKQITLQEGFQILVGTALGLRSGSKAIGKEASDATVTEREEVSKIRKSIDIVSFIESSDLKGYKAVLEKLEEASEVLKEAKKPFNEKRKPLNKAWSFSINVAIPESLAELGNPVSERRTVPSVLAKEIESYEKEKKAK